MTRDKPLVMLSFEEGGRNGGPYVSHERLMRSSLRSTYDFERLVVPSGRRGLLNPKLVLNLVRQIRDVNPDLVHIHGLQLVGFHAAMAARVARKPVVLGVHGSTREAIDFPVWKRRLVTLAETLTLRSASVVYVVSEYVANWPSVQKHARRFGGVVANMPETRTDCLSGSGIRAELGISPDDVVVVSTGRITVEKGYRILTDVICQIGCRKGVKFIIAGDGDYLVTMRTKLQDCGVADQVFLLGFRTDVFHILRECDIFISCSLHETFSMSVLEAGFAGLPSVAPNVGGVPELIIDGVNGLLTSPADTPQISMALLRLIQDRSTRDRLGRNAERIAREKGSAPEIASKIERLYSEVLR